MCLLKLFLLATTFSLVACSLLPSEVSSPRIIKNAAPTVVLGFEGKTVNEMVSNAHSMGAKASEFLASGLFIKGNDASMHGDHQTAVRLFGYVVQLQPRDNYLKRKLSIELIRNGELKEAEKILVTIFKEQHTNDNTIGLILAEVYTSLEKPNRAQVIYQEIIRRGTDTEEACLFYAKSLSLEKKIVSNHSPLAKCDKDIKNNSIYLFFRGEIEYKKGNFALAKRLLEKSLKLNRSYAPTVLVLGKFHEDKKDFKSAVIIYKNFLTTEGNRTNLIVLSRLVTLLFSLDETTAVIPYLETLSSLDNSDLNLKVRLGLLYSDSGRYQQAINIFNDVLSVVPDSDKVLYYLGVLKEQTNHYQEAIEFFKRVPETSDLYRDAQTQVEQMLSPQNLSKLKKTGNQTILWASLLKKLKTVDNR